MKNTLKKSALALSLGSALLTGCPGPVDNDPDAGVDAGVDAGNDAGVIEKEVVTAPTEITTDTTWTADKVYLLKEHLFVKGGTLKIEAGTTIQGEGNAALVISRDAKIDAQGTAAAPIVMTSGKVEGERAPGNWGGVVLLGKGKLNVSGGEQQVEGFPAGTPAVMFGGNDNTHDCGKLKYVRIEYAGHILTGNNEINGLTLGGCGDKTEIDYVQVHKGSDDGVEIFGGAVNLKHVVISQGLDDSLDWDLGWTGKAQFVVIQQDPGQGNYGFESDSNGSTPKEAPVSNPELFNVTLVGAGNGNSSKEQGGMLLREGTGGRMANIIITQFKSFVINVASRESVEHSYVVTGDAEPYTFTLKPAAEQQLFLKNSMFFANGYEATTPVAGGDLWPTPEPAMKNGELVERGDITFDQEAFFKLAEYSNGDRRIPS